MSNIDFGLPSLYEDLAFVCLGGGGSAIGLELYKKGYQCLFINSSDQDQSILQEVPDYMKIKLLGTRGNSANRNKGKQYIKSNYRKIIKDIVTKLNGFSNYYIVNSSGGGTGSSFCTTVATFLKALLPDVTISFITILPSYNEPYIRKTNTLELYNEFLELDLDKFGNIFFVDNNGISSNEEIDLFNKKVVETLDFIFNLSTNNKNIDDADLLQMLSISGCVNIGYISSKQIGYRLNIDNCFVESSGNASNIIYDINSDDNIIEEEIHEKYGIQDNVLYTFRNEVSNNVVLFGLSLPTEYFELLAEYCEDHNKSKLNIEQTQHKKIEINTTNKILQSKEDIKPINKSIDDIFNNLFGNK